MASMENQFEQIRDQQKQSWNRFSPGWRKWDEFNMRFLKPMGDAIIDNLINKRWGSCAGYCGRNRRTRINQLPL